MLGYRCRTPPYTTVILHEAQLLGCTAPDGRTAPVAHVLVPGEVLHRPENLAAGAASVIATLQFDGVYGPHRDTCQNP